MPIKNTSDSGNNPTRKLLLSLHRSSLPMAELVEAKGKKQKNRQKRRACTVHRCRWLSLSKPKATKQKKSAKTQSMHCSSLPMAELVEAKGNEAKKSAKTLSLLCHFERSREMTVYYFLFLYNAPFKLA
jgi:glycerol-3-phosphate cytidylyltransferase-like family protein